MSTARQHNQAGRVLGQLSSERLREASEVLARAFVDNPATLALVPYPSSRRLRVLERVMRGFTRATLIDGDAIAVIDGGRVAGVSLAFGPRRYPLGMRARAWQAYGPIAAGPRTALSYAIADQYLAKLHFTDPHWYLFVLGVEPELQGRGIGGRLLRWLGERAGEDGVPCYLETDKASSVRLYERHGFRVLVEETHARTGIHFWTMLRSVSAA